MKVALGHHWLVSMRGGEKVTEEFCNLFPEADIHTLVTEPSRLSATIRKHRIRPSPVQKIPGAARRYKSLLPIYPFFLKRMKVDADVNCVLTLDASILKGLVVPEGVPHVCYCCSPPRYLFEQQEEYLSNMEGMNGVKRAAIRALTPSLQRFDREAAQKVDRFITLSTFIQGRISRCYGRESTVIYPPVSVADFTPREATEDFYLVVSQLVPYKRIDLAVSAFNKLGKRLVVIGEGRSNVSKFQFELFHRHRGSRRRGDLRAVQPVKQC